jgi:hypothetical protein
MPISVVTEDELWFMASLEAKSAAINSSTSLALSFVQFEDDDLRRASVPFEEDNLRRISAALPLNGLLMSLPAASPLRATPGLLESLHLEPGRGTVISAGDCEKDTSDLRIGLIGLPGADPIMVFQDSGTLTQKSYGAESASRLEAEPAEGAMYIGDERHEFGNGLQVTLEGDFSVSSVGLDWRIEGRATKVEFNGEEQLPPRWGLARSAPELFIATLITSSAVCIVGLFFGVFKLSFERR